MDFDRAFMRRKLNRASSVINPVHYTDDFSENKGYFTEENGTDDWKIENGMLSTVAGSEANLTYVHIYEKNVCFRARLRYSEPTNSGALFSLVLRYNADAAYVRCVYYPCEGYWVIQYREGADFLTICSNVAWYKMNPEEWYDVTFSLDEATATLSVNGEVIRAVAPIEHDSCGRVAIAAQNLALDVDSVDISFLSNQGTLWKDVVHHKLQDDKFLEGGTVLEMKDGSLTYTHHAGDTYISTNNGKNWTMLEKPYIKDGGSRINVLRLRNGKFIRIARRDTDVEDQGYMAAYLSDDDGKTWEFAGDICKTPLMWNSKAYASNMNDKLTEMSDGRIFYPQNYECYDNTNIDGRTVFCEFYYSDDCGKTWQKSETDSWTIPGNEQVPRFGECKVLECDDGSLRMYNSWNTHECIVYSESLDRGKTWGPLIKIPEFECSCSTMQFWRDPYADNETTYYMVWCYCPSLGPQACMMRSRLVLSRSYNGKDWHFLGDVWRWDSKYFVGSSIAHVVDDFVMTTKDYVICGSGFSEQIATEHVPGNSYHHAQRQHIYSIKKENLVDLPLKPLLRSELIY